MLEHPAPSLVYRIPLSISDKLGIDGAGEVDTGTLTEIQQRNRHICRLLRYTRQAGLNRRLRPIVGAPQKQLKQLSCLD